MSAPALTFGCWVDCAIDSIDAAYAARFREMGFTTAALMSNRMNAHPGDPAWELRAKHATFARASKHLRDAGVEVVLTCWPRPNPEQLGKLERDMTLLVDECEAVAIEVDIEANWHSSFRQKFASLDEASVEVLAVLRRIARGRRVEANTYTYHRELSPNARITPHVDLIVPQAYSVNERSQEHVPWDSILGPGSMQDLTLDRAASTGATASALTACGLAAYEQRWPGKAPSEAMAKALGAARRRGVQHVRYWSSKWVVGASAGKQPWVPRFIREAAGSAPR